MMKRYKQLLTYIKSAVTRNYSEKSINSILDYISTSKQVRQKREAIARSAHVPAEKGGKSLKVTGLIDRSTKETAVAPLTL